MTNARVMQVANSLNSALANYDNKTVTAEKYYNKAEIDDKNTYSTEEIDTGKTWIDGKKLYRKVLRLNYSNSIVLDTYLPSNISFCLKEYIYAKRYSGETVEDFYFSSSDYMQTMIVNNYNGNKVTFMGRNSASTEYIIISLLYTKTTD